MSRSIQDIDLGSIVFSKQKVKSSNKFLYVYSERKPLIIKMPVMRLPFGLQKDNFSNKNQYLLDLSFQGHEELLAKFKELDDVIISKVKDQFYPDEDLDSVKHKYVSCIKTSNDPKYAPTLRTKIITNEAHKVKCDFYNSERDENGKYPKIDLDDNGGETYLLMRMAKGSSHQTIVECIGLWFFNDKFGLSFKVSQALLSQYQQAKPEERDDCGFLSSDSESTNEDADFLGE
jgi:hypothetical protein